MKRPEGIDIIIPIYNAYEDLQTCVASVLEYTDLGRHRLILVNDASPDGRIAPYLNTLGEYQNVLIVENEKNLGFSGSINHGIEISATRDVILLNSDTIVTKNWAEKMIACAYSDAAIATVTPLSNNATLCSVPEFLQENILPEGYTLEMYAELIEHVSLRSYPRIPVANGFCMYVKREVIEKIGSFDMITFERGYGEENDFCYRAEQIGYHQVMCDDTYIYHTGTSSFISDEKKKYIEAHEKILNERYPAQNHAVAVHCRDNPNERIQENIKLWTGLLNGRKNILYLVQSDFRKDAHDHLGGTQLHVKDMMSIMRSEYNVFVAARNIDYLNLTAYTSEKEYTFKFYIGNEPAYTEFRSKRFAELYGRILDCFAIDLVHIHHTKGLTLELYYQADQRGISIVTTLHDYYAICPSIKMINCHGELCIDRPDKQCCSECQKKLVNIYEHTDYLKVWQSAHKDALNLSSVIVTPSKSAQEFISSYYPDLSDRFLAIYHGMEPMRQIPDTCKTPGFRVAFIGGISKEKGSLASCQLIKNSPSGITWHLFGVWGYNDLSMLERKNYIKTGLYEREELPDLMEKHRIDLVCILPIWPETYCYTLSEAIMCGVPVIATDIGALGERVRKLNCGWLVIPEHAYEEALAIIQRIQDKGAEYQEKHRLIRSLKVKSLGEMAQEYKKIYRKRLFNTAMPKYNADLTLRKFALDGYFIANGKMLCMEADGTAIQERLEQLDAQITAITSSFTYKCMRALGEIHIPGRKYIKKALYAAYRIAKH